MRLIKPSISMLDASNPAKLIEVAGRTCWKSEDKIEEGSAAKFINMLLDKGHLAMIEFSNFVFEVSPHVYNWVAGVPDRQFIRITMDGRFLVSGSARAFIEFYMDNMHMFSALFLKHLIDAWPDIFQDIEMDMNLRGSLLSIMNQVSFVDQDTLKGNEYFVHYCFGYNVVCDRGVTHEIVRHRPFSYSQESTRYCNYSGGVTYIIPPWVDLEPGNYSVEQMSIYMFEKDELINIPLDVKNWLSFLYEAECTYQGLMNYKPKWSAQKARSVLTNALKTEINIYGNVRQWAHFFKLRTSPKAHPQMQEVALMIKDDLKEKEILD